MTETFETLKAKIASWLIITSITRFPDADRGDCINMAQQDLLERFRLRYGETSDTKSVTAGDYDYDMPDRFVEFYSVWYVDPDTNEKAELDYVPYDEFSTMYPDLTDASKRGSPTHYTFWGSTMYIGPSPDISFTMNRDYYQYLADLANGSPSNTNVFVADNWKPLFWEGLKLACKFTHKQERIMEFKDEADKSIASLVRAHTKARSRGRKAVSNLPGKRHGGR